jgi:benzoyl-CoA reductase/2-hydroxyglutaryl-CoA dehydratase subunit BcrC/BadD/HgdB
MYSGLLELCGFEPDEIERERPRIDRAFEIWQITAEDINRAEDRIKRFFDLELTGMRKFRGICLKEFIDLTLAKEEGKKIVYSSFPPVAQVTGSMALMSDEVYCSVPEPMIMTVMGQYFGKLGPILEKAEEFWLPPGQAHCPFLQARLASVLGGMIPMPDLLIPVGLTCDQAGKTDEIIEYLHGIPVVHIDGCSDEDGERWPHANPRRVQYLVQELKNVARVFQEVIGLEFTEETMARGLAEWGKLKVIFDEISELRGWADPVPLSEKDWENICTAMVTCAGRTAREGVDAASILLEELRERTRRGVGVLEKGAPRVINLFPHASDPSVTEVIEKAGLASVTNFISVAASSLPDEYESIWEQLADRHMRGGQRSSGQLTINELKELCREWDIDGVIIAALSKCRIYNTFPRKAKEVLEREMDIPVLALEQDSVDSREYSAERFRTRVEPFAEILKDRKKRALKGGK